jgi:phenylacetate-CoA ligase
MRKEIEQRLNLLATDNYGLSEVGGPGLAGECAERKGLHVAEDHFLVEVIHPETLAPVAPGEVGELVVTTLTREALPVVRFRTRDLASIDPRRVKGRSDDLLFLQGAKVFPSEIEHVLFEVEGAAPHYQIALERRGAVDVATLLVEVSESTFFDEMKRLAQMRDRIERRLASELGVVIEVKLVGKNTLERSEGKARRVVDRRGT